MQENKKKDLTIKELAEELNVTKQCIYYKLSTDFDLKKHVYKKDGVKFITKTGADLINNSLNNQSKEIKESEIGNPNSLVAEIYENHIRDLNKEIEHLKKETEEKNNIINSVLKESKEKNKLLENMQVLLKDQKILIESYEQKKSKWKFWKNKNYT